MRILRRSDTLGLIGLEECVPAVEEAFRLHGLRRTLEARRAHVPALSGGAFHITAGGVARGDVGVVGIKLNGRFPPAHAGGSQRVSGAILLADAATGAPLALMDSMVVTGVRTAAVTVIATRLLARRDAERALLVGAGRQAAGQVEALAMSGRISRVDVHDLVSANAERIADGARALGLEATVADDVRAAARKSDVVVTVTPATTPILMAGDVSSGGLVIALGADGPGKQELDPRLLAESKVVVDVIEQAQESGELQHALRAELLSSADVYAELGEVVAGVKPGRTSADETFIFDATGTALQDVAAAELLLSVAQSRGLGVVVELGG